MKIVALVSGGKDSCYNMMQCVANGHEIVALANLKPPTSSGKDELDSFMYQTVGHDAIHLYSECMGVPLYRREILGESVIQGSDYRVADNDETEDLFLLLQDVLRNHPDVKGVSVGAILSNYQRVRVEHVCNRLGLTSFAYLWRREQKELLYEMANAGVNAILIKIAAIGLKPVHLGKSIGQMYPYLCKMNDMYDLHICGEGGEYETFTIDCPLFKKRIIVEETETVIHSDDAFAQVAYLRFKKLSTEEKTQDEMDMDNVVIQDWKEWNRYDEIVSAINNTTHTAVTTPKLLPVSQSSADHVDYTTADHAPFFAIGGTTAFDKDPSITFETIEEETIACMNAVQEKLTAKNLDWSDLVTMNVFVSNMGDFGRINAIYKTYFDINPSPRALVGANLKGNAKLQIDAIAIKSEKKETMHVQGISYWAPANIGPYSQSVTTLGHAFIAGQIGLVPNTLDLPSPPSFANEAALSLRNLENIVSVLDMSLSSNTALCYCFVSDPKYLPLAKVAWETYMERVPPTLYVAIPALPRGAMVEWQVVLDAPVPAVVDEDENTTDDEQDRDTLRKLKDLKLQEPAAVSIAGNVQCRAVKKNSMTAITAQITDAENIEDAVNRLVSAVDRCLREYEKKWNQVLSLRVFHFDKLDLSTTQLFAQEINQKSNQLPTITSIPASALGSDGNAILACTVHVL